ncbi:MAG TPA: M1 family aminopeptidase [Gemmatimonadaceae bacterium]|nr:M1 family aminopeptidase [Gemmatimonadaceae bacterium]
MFWTVFTFELAYWFKRPLTLLFFALFFLLAFFSTASDSFLSVGGTGQIHRNAPFALATATGVLTAIGQVITTAIAGTAVLRDAQLGTEELLFTTQISKAGYLLGRFVAAFAIMAVIYVALPIGLIVGTLMPWVPADKLGPITLAGAFQPFLIIALPNLLFVSALLFAVGALTRKLFAVYITGIILLVAWQITQQIVGQLDKLTLASLIDPFALTTVGVASRYWSVAEKNTLLVPAGGAMLQNRLLWIAIAFALFGLVAAVFRLRLQGGGAGRKKKGGEAESSVRAVLVIPAVTLRYDSAAWWRTFFQQGLFHLRSIVREAPFLAISAICVLNTMVDLWYSSHPQDSARWPVTSMVATSVSNDMFVFVVLLATLYGGELVWRERQLKTDQLQDAMPVPLWVTFGGKLLGVFLAIMVLMVVSTACAMLMQMAQGYFRLQPLLYLEILATINVPTALAIVALAMGVHAAVNQKFVGHLVMIAYWVVVPVLSTIGFDHRLYQVGRSADFVYSDMNRWGPYLPRALVFETYSIACCLLVAALGYLILVRGTETNWFSRRTGAAARWRRGGAISVGGLGVLALLLAGVFLYNANSLNAYTDVRTAERRVKAWELKYKPLAALPKPRLVAVTLRHDYFPERRAAVWHGTLRAVNRDSRAVDTLFISIRATGATPTNRFEANSNSGLQLDSLVFDRDATLLVDDLTNGVRLYRFAKPLAPGESLSVHFAGKYEPRGFPNDAFNNDVAANGSFMASDYVPSFGYQEGNELADDDIRQRNDLKPKPRMKTLDDPAVRLNNYITSDADWIAFDETTCTAPDQISIAPGYLDKEWTENGRRCVHYTMDKPILDFYATLSARYDVYRTNYNGVNLEIYHQPEHTFALPSMIQASKDGLDYFGAHFSPYLYRQYRIIEFPRYQGFAQAFPNTIPYSESIGFIYRKVDGDDKVDLAYFVTAHELAHQWWAHQVVGGNGQGATMFSEGLAEYSALTVMEKRFGREAAQKFLRRELDGYLRGRGVERKKEVPLLYVENQPYIHYQKGSLCFYALRDYIGEDAMNSALHAFLEKWGLKGPPYPTARDLYSEFDRVTPDSLKYVLKDLFEEMTFYENKADSATTTKRADGTYAVHLVLRAKKLKGDSLGNTKEVPMADYVDVGVFGEHVAGQKLGAPLLVKKIRITQPVTAVDLIVAKEPQKAGIDPYNKLIDRTPEDNVIAVKRE